LLDKASFVIAITNTDLTRYQNRLHNAAKAAV